MKPLSESLMELAARELGPTRRWWAGTKDSLHREIATLRTDFADWRAESAERDRERVGRDTQADAITAVAVAGYCLDAAEWAVLRAWLLAAKPFERRSGTKEAGGREGPGLSASDE